MHVATLALAGVVLVWANRGQWFQSDEFDFLANRGLFGNPELHLFVPHNEHWSTLPILVWRGLYALFGLTTYTPYVLLLVALHLGLAHLLWRTARDGGAPAAAATAVAAGFLVLGAGFENLLWAFQSTFLGSLLLGVVHVRLVTRTGGDRPGRDDALGVLAGVGALMCSGVGVTMVAVAGLAALLRRGWRAAAVAVGPPALVYLVWFGLAGRRGLAGGGLDVATVARIPAYAARGVVAATTGLLGPGFVGVVAALGLLGSAVVWIRTDRARSAAVVALAAGPLAFFTLVGLGRLADSPDPASSRYVYVAIALLVPALARAGGELLRGLPAPASAAVWCILAAALVVPGGLRLAAEAARYAEVEQAWRGRLLAVADLLAEEPGAVVTQQVTTDLQTDELARMDAEGHLPDDQPDARAVAEGRLLVGIGPVAAPGLVGAPPVVVGVGRATTVAAGPGCRDVIPGGSSPQVALAVREPTTLTITAPPGEDRVLVDVRLRAPGAGTEVARPTPLALTPSAPTPVATSVTGELVLTLPADGISRLCGLAAGP